MENLLAIYYASYNKETRTVEEINEIDKKRCKYREINSFLN